MGQAIRLLHLRLKEMLVGPVVVAQGTPEVAVAVRVRLVRMEPPAL